MPEPAATYPSRTIDELAVHVGSGATPRGGSEVYQSEGVLFIRSQNVRFEGLDLRDVAFIDPRTHATMARSVVWPHDVLLNITGASIGRCCVLPNGLGDANVNQHVCAIRLPEPNHGDATFLSNVLASHIGQHQIDVLNAGGNREGLNYQQLRAFVVPWPDGATRHAIAEILHTVDEAIRKTEEIIAKLKQVKQGLLHDLLTRGIDDNGELRDPDRHPEQFKDSPLGRIPKAWEMVAIRRLCARVTYGFTNPMPTTDSGPWMLTAADVGYDQIAWETARHTSPLAFRRLTAKSKPEPGDLLVTKDGTLGRIAVLDRDGVCINQSVALLRPRDPALTSYIATYLLAPQGQERMLADAGGSTIKHIYISRLAEMEIPLPPLGEAQRIADAFDALRSRERSEHGELAKLRVMKRGLMEDLLTGRVRVTQLREEAAE